VQRGTLGAALPRLEDRRLLGGEARYLADLPATGALHLRLVRSIEAHGLIHRIGLPPARPGAWVITAADLGSPALALHARYQPGQAPMPDRPLLAADRVRFVGEPVAAVLAGDQYEAEDLAERVTVDIEPLPAAVDPQIPPPPGWPLHSTHPDNILYRELIESGQPDTRITCRTVRRIFRTRRHSGVPLETRGCLASVTGGVLTVWSSTQVPHLLRSAIADTLHRPEGGIHVHVPDVGGGFGVKGHAYPEEVLTAALAVLTGRTVRWVEDRCEHLQASIHARDHRHTVELDVDDNGRFLALRAHLVIDCGAYLVWPQTAALEARMAANVLPGPYTIENYRCQTEAVCTNKSPLGTYRGVARPSAVFSIERLVDEAALEVGLDAVEIRRRNLITQFPYTTCTGLTYDSGSYLECLAAAAAAVEQDRGTAPGLAGNGVRETSRGVGFACFVEQSAHIPPWAAPSSGLVLAPDKVMVSVDGTGRIIVDAGITSHGQGQETTLAQVVAEMLGILADSVAVRCGGESLYSMGTLASRSAVIAGNAAAAAADALASQLRAHGARDLGVEPSGVQLSDVRVVARQGSVTFAELARNHPTCLTADGQPGLSAEAIYEGFPGGTFSNACHAAVVEVDRGTGQVRVCRYVVAEDCGKIINPLVVNGQIEGGVVQGIGSALLEELIYEDNGQLVTTTLMDYRLPSMLEAPTIEIAHLESPAANPLGVKGVGESGAIGPMAAVANAVADALGPGLAGKVTEVPLLPARVWAILQGEAS
jgi:carbon-monoxide dehydrogenase large subunit